MTQEVPTAGPRLAAKLARTIPLSSRPGANLLPQAAISAFFFRPELIANEPAYIRFDLQSNAANQH